MTINTELREAISRIIVGAVKSASIAHPEMNARALAGSIAKRAAGGLASLLEGELVSSLGLQGVVNRTVINHTNLKAALKATIDFLYPEIRRGPADDDWMEMMGLVADALNWLDCNFCKGEGETVIETRSAQTRNLTTGDIYKEVRVSTRTELCSACYGVKRRPPELGEDQNESKKCPFDIGDIVKCSDFRVAWGAGVVREIEDGKEAYRVDFPNAPYGINRPSVDSSFEGSWVHQAKLKMVKKNSETSEEPGEEESA
jgi:hypothetical protein